MTTVNSIQATVGQFTTFVTVGVTDRFDLSLALPVLANDMTVVSDATIQRLGTTDPLTHFFRQATGEVGTRRIFTAIRSASGVGDLIVRAKQTLLKGASNGVAVGLDVRLPTGDAMELLGTGTAGLGPFAVWSASFSKVSPHVNAGYQWNGSSVLAGDPATGTSARLSRCRDVRRGSGRQREQAADGRLRRPRPVHHRRGAAPARRSFTRSTENPPSPTSPSNRLRSTR